MGAWTDRAHADPLVCSRLPAGRCTHLQGGRGDAVRFCSACPRPYSAPASPVLSLSHRPTRSQGYAPTQVSGGEPQVKRRRDPRDSSQAPPSSDRGCRRDARRSCLARHQRTLLASCHGDRARRIVIGKQPQALCGAMIGARPRSSGRSAWAGRGIEAAGPRGPNDLAERQPGAECSGSPASLRR